VFVEESKGDEVREAGWVVGRGIVVGIAVDDSEEEKGQRGVGGGGGEVVEI